MRPKRPAPILAWASCMCQRNRTRRWKSPSLEKPTTKTPRAQSGTKHSAVDATKPFFVPLRVLRVFVVGV